jgi:hypothetical protein
MRDEPRFTVEQEFNREALLSEAAEVVRYSGVDLSRESKGGLETAGPRHEVLELLEKLGREQATFAPALPCRAIRAEHFSDRQVTIPRDLEEDFRQFDYFCLDVPVTLIPRSGWMFTRLECRIDFSTPDGAHLFVHDVFPEDKWVTLMEAETHLNLGVDEELKFRTEVSDPAGESSAGAKVGADAGAKVVLGPFSYVVRRPLVQAWGRKNTFVFWRLDGRADAGEEEVSLGVILKVRKSRRGPVSAKGVLKAYHDFNLLSATLRDFIESFTPLVKSLFTAGVVLSATGEWDDVTA